MDKDYNVVDMGIVVEVISQLEKYAITKEALEATRLGKHINELRRKASDKTLASRAKSLVKKWRELLMPASGNATPVHTTSKEQPKAVAAAAAQRLNGHVTSQPSSRLTSPAVSASSGSRLSPGLNPNLARPQPHNSSSLPSSASSSPGLSRPTTPNNNHISSSSSRPVSPAVPKTNVANKRLRKEFESDIVNSDLPPSSKKAKVDLIGQVNGSSLKLAPNCDTTTNNKTLNGHTNQRMSRKKQLEQEREQMLEQKLLTARRQSSKVRTTQELVQELALRSSTPNAGMRTSNGSNSSAIVNETKTELMNRFFSSQQNGNHSDVLSPPLSDGSPASPINSLMQQKPSEDLTNPEDTAETVEDILAQLPPIDSALILAEINAEMANQTDQEVSDQDSDQEDIQGLIPALPVTATNAAVVKKKDENLSEEVKAKLVEELHQGQHESVNGNYNHDGAFREWHEMVTKETVNGDLLYILPYSVID